MTFTTSEPITVDGVRLDTYAYAVEMTDGLRSTPGVRASDTTLPGVNGVIPDMGDVFDSSDVVINMWVGGVDENGNIGAGQNRRKLYERNLDAIFHLFAVRGRLLDVRRTMPDGTTRQAFCRVVSSIVPKPINKSDTDSRLSVALENPSGFWQDIADQTYTSWAGGTEGENIIDTLSGATAPIDDAVFVVHGPINNPTLTDPATGYYVKYSGALVAGQDWRVNSGTWESVIGTGIGFDGAGTSVIAQTVYDGSARLLPLQPARTSNLLTGLRVVTVSLTGTGFAGTTRLEVRGRRKYL